MKSNASNRSFVSLLIALGVALGICSPVQLKPFTKSQAATLQPQDEDRPRYVPGQLLVKFKNAPSSELLRQYHCQIKERLDRPKAQRNQPQSHADNSQTYLVTFDVSQAPQNVAAQISTQEDVEYAEPNYLYALQVIPNDPLYLAPPNAYFIDGQWGHQRVGLEGVWPEKSRTEAIVINLDTGIDVNHPDLRPNLWVSTGEIPGNGTDDDGNGYIDDINGWDFMANRADVSDVAGHGTSIAGLGARGNNAMGVAGVSWDCKMMTLRVSDANGATISSVIQAIKYATATLTRQGKHGVFNASFGGPGRSQALADAIRESGELFVAAAGNSGPLDPNVPIYPAAFTAELPNVLSATASIYDVGDPVMPGAAFGPTNSPVCPDLAAPGAWIATTERGGGYTHVGGTSLAAPYVAHTLAMMLDLTNGDPLAAKARVLKSVDVVPALSGKVKTGGRLNIDRAFHGRFNPNQPPTANMSTTAFSVGEGDVLPLALSVSDPDGDPVTVTWDFGDGTRATGAAVSHVYQNMGSYSLVATATDGLVSVTIASTATVNDAVRITQVKLKKYDPVAGTGKKLSVTAIDSRQSQTPRPTLTIIGVGEMIYDEESRAYTFFIKKARNLPSALTIRSSLGGEATRSWQ